MPSLRATIVKEALGICRSSGDRFCGLLQPFLDIALRAILLHKSAGHRSVGTTMVFPPPFDRRWNLPSIWLHLELVVYSVRFCDFPIVVPPDPNSLLLRLAFRKGCFASPGTGICEFRPSIALNGLADSVLESFLHDDKTKDAI